MSERASSPALSTASQRFPAAQYSVVPSRTSSPRPDRTPSPVGPRYRPVSPFQQSRPDDHGSTYLVDARGVMIYTDRDGRYYVEE